MAKKVNAQLDRKDKNKSTLRDPMPRNDKLLSDLTRYGDRAIHLSEILYYASERTVEQYKVMRMHPMYWLGLNFLKLGLSNVPFNVEYEEDENIRLIAEKMLKKVWRRMFRDALEKLEYGFKCMEIRWEVSGLKYIDEKGNEQVFIGHLFKQPRSIDGETVEILVEQGVGTLRGFRQDYEEARTCLTEDRKALIFTHNLESGNFYGISALEPGFQYWYDANLNRQFHMRWLERKGTGFFKGFYPEGETETEDGLEDNQDIMLGLLDTIMEGNAIAIPSDRDDEGNLLWDIEFMSDEDKTNPFIDRANYVDEMILKSLVIPEKALTQGEIGARSSIEAFQDLFLQRKQDILDDTVDTIDKYYLKHFIEVNFGQDLDIHVTPGKLDDTSVDTAKMIVEKLLEKGKIKIGNQWLIDKTGIPIEEEEEPEIPPFMKEEEDEGDSETEDFRNGEEDEGEEETTDKDANKKEKGSKEKEDVKKLADIQHRWRALDQWEEQYNLAGLETNLDRRKSEFMVDLTDELNFQYDRISRYLDKNYNADGKSVTAAKGVEIKQSKIKQVLRSYLNDIYKYSYSTIESGVEGVSKFATTDTATRFIGFRVDVTANKFATDLESDLKYTLNQGLDTLKSKPEIQDDLFITFQKFLSAKLTNTAETELGFMLGKGVDDYIRENKKKVKKGLLSADKEVMRVKYSAIMDKDVCDYCREVDGIVVAIDSGLYKRYDTPAHYHCRCVWLPMTAREIRNPRIKGTEITFNASGRPLTIEDIVSGKMFMVEGAKRRVGRKIDLRTFSDPGSRELTPIIHFHKEKEIIREQKGSDQTTIPIEVKIDMTDMQKVDKQKPAKRVVKIIRDEDGNLSGAEINEEKSK